MGDVPGSGAPVSSVPISGGLRFDGPAVEAACVRLAAAERALLERGGVRPEMRVQSSSGIGEEIDAVLIGLEVSRRSLAAGAGVARGSLSELLGGLTALDRSFAGVVAGRAP